GFFGHNLYALDAATGASLWSYSIQDASSPVVANGRVYVAYGPSELFALDATTGTELWSFYTGNGGVPVSAAVANGVVYWGTGFSLHALDAATGADLWSAQGPGDVASPAVADGVVYAGSGDSVSAFHLCRGQVIEPVRSLGSPEW